MTRKPAEIDYYRILGVHQDAILQEIRTAYRKKALATHPDKKPGIDPTAFHKVQEAWETLQDEQKRYCFDCKYPRIKTEWDKYEAARKARETRATRERPRDTTNDDIPGWDFDDLKRTVDEIGKSFQREQHERPQGPPPPPRRRRNGNRICTHRRWWPRVYHVDSCQFCGRHCPIYTLRCPDCDARACVPCKIRESSA